MLILIFDTETTGIIPKDIYNIEQCPYIIQFSYIVYDMKNYKIINEYNKIIHLHEKINISEESTSIHGITNEMTKKSKTSIKKCLQDFKKNIEICDYIIGHNIDFDIKMVEIECQRNNLKMNLFKNPDKIFCTMQNSINICKIEAQNIMGKYYKWPKLSELHFHLFQFVPHNLHDAYNDILICLRCAVFLLKKIDIIKKDSVFKRKIKLLIN